MSPSISFSTKKKEGLRASKWMHLRALLDKSELESLFELITPCSVVCLSKLGSREQLFLSHQALFSLYEKYLGSLRDEPLCLKREFSLALVKEQDSIDLTELKKDCFAVKLIKPCVQISLFEFFYDPYLDECFFNQHSKEGVRFGLQFSFPHFYEDECSRKPIEHFKDVNFSHTCLFKSLQKWMRDFTSPLVLKKGEKSIKTAVKIGKKASWLTRDHRDLLKCGLRVELP